MDDQELMEFVFAENGKVVTDSLTVSEKFERRHDNVLRDIAIQIEKLKEAKMEEWSLLNFEESKYLNERGREYIKINLTADAFALVAMAYVTPKAMQMKVKFLEAFKRMKMELEQLKSENVIQPSYMIADPIARAERWIEEERERQALQEKTEELNQQVVLMGPKADYYDSILSSEDTMVITQIAKDYGLSGKKLNAILHEANIIYKVNDEWVLYAKHQDKGYTESQTIKIEHHDGRVGAKVHMRWTQQGRLLIHKVLTKRGIIPMSDRKQPGGGAV